MFDNIPIEKRLRLFLGLLGLAFLLSLAYGWQTLGLQSRVAQLEIKTAGLEDADLQIAHRQVRLKELTDAIRTGQENGHAITSHADFLGYTQGLCSHLELKIMEIPLETVQDLDGYLIARIDLSLEGMFHDLLQFLYRVEHIDRVASTERVLLERKTIRIRGQAREVLIAHLRLNRLLNQAHDA